jgi:hypothetical protein
MEVEAAKRIDQCLVARFRSWRLAIVEGTGAAEVSPLEMSAEKEQTDSGGSNEGRKGRDGTVQLKRRISA